MKDRRIFINKYILQIVSRRERMVKYCPYCGIELEADYKFCPDCGKQVPTGKKGAKHEKEKTPEKEEIEEKVEAKEKPKEKAKKKAKFKFKLPKLSLKIPKKTAIIILAIVCVVIVASAGAWVVIKGNPFGAAVVPPGKIFTITVENAFGTDADCHFLIDNLPQGTYGNPGFTVNASETKVITINEDDLIYQGRDSYPIKLFATIDGSEGFPDYATALAVTESAEFVIDNVEGRIDEFYVNCTVHL